MPAPAESSLVNLRDFPREWITDEGKRTAQAKAHKLDPKLAVKTAQLSEDMKQRLAAIHPDDARTSELFVDDQAQPNGTLQANVTKTITGTLNSTPSRNFAIDF